VKKHCHQSQHRGGVLSGRNGFFEMSLPKTLDGAVVCWLGGDVRTLGPRTNPSGASGGGLGEGQNFGEAS